MGAKENAYQAKLINKIKERFPGCMVMKNDANYIQGVPDLTVLHGKRWATLECKRDASASKRPNQEYYVEQMNEMSFSRFVYPENEEEVLREISEAFET